MNEQIIDFFGFFFFHYISELFYSVGCCIGILAQILGVSFLFPSPVVSGWCPFKLCGGGNLQISQWLGNQLI